jgi:hypothetical protein
VGSGGAKGTRTPNPLLAKQVRYQLRHGPVADLAGIRTRRVCSVERVGDLGPKVPFRRAATHATPDDVTGAERQKEDEQLLHENLLVTARMGRCRRSGEWG